MNLAYFYPEIYWNTANLIVDSASSEGDSENDEETQEQEQEEEIVSIYEPEDYDTYDYIDLPDRSGKIKKAKKTVDYGKISMAIGRFKSYGIDVLPPDINHSKYTFIPNEETNTITYGLHGITRISNELIEEIISKRPYLNLEDFLSKIKVNKPQALNLIKSGAMDIFGDRIELLKKYILSVSDQKQRLTLQNMQMLIDYECIPEEMSKYGRFFLFNKFLKKNKQGVYYNCSDKAAQYIADYFSDSIIEDGCRVLQKTWDKIYDKAMDPMREYLKAYKNEMLSELNEKLFQEQWNKYAEGNISKYEMESLGFYYHEHELDSFQNAFDDYNLLPDDPVIERTFPGKDGKQIPIYKLSLLIGTVVNKDKTHNSFSLLTPTGLVNVKLYKQQWPIYDHQISEKKDGEDKKTVIEKSWLTRGTLLMVQGFKREQQFVLKKYKGSAFPVITKLSINNDNKLEYQYERMDEE